MKQRRVGTFTLGISLILIGIIIPLTLIFKENALQILQFSPLILIVLGIEVLVYAMRFKEDKLKYDGLSIFMVIMISVVTIGTSAIVPTVDRFIEARKTYTQAEKTVRNELEDIVADQQLDANVHIYPYHDYYGITIDLIDISDNFNCNIDIQEKTELTKEQAVAKVNTFFQAVKAKDISFDDMRMTIETPKNHYSFVINKSQLNNFSTSYIEKRMESANIEPDNQSDQVESETTSNS